MAENPYKSPEARDHRPGPFSWLRRPTRLEIVLVIIGVIGIVVAAVLPQRSSKKPKRPPPAPVQAPATQPVSN
jgi:hypothetical protein